MDLIKVNDSIYLSEPIMDDCPLLAEYLNDKEIYNNTLTLPSPYLLSDAEECVKRIEQERLKGGRLKEYAIRRADGGLIGLIGYAGNLRGNTHSVKLGYSLAKKYWGNGIMTACINKLCGILLKQGIVRIEASVFEYNKASQRVMEKCGFELEGVLKKAYFKNERMVDAYLYAMVV